MAIPLLRFFFRTAKKAQNRPLRFCAPVELPERFPPLWEVAPSVVGRCRPAFSERRPKPVLLPGSFCVPLRHRLSDLSQNKTTFLFPKQKIIANPLSMRICRYFVHFLNFFQNPKQDVKSYLCQSPIETAILRPAELTNLSPIETANLNPIKEAITILLHVL